MGDLNHKKLEVNGLNHFLSIVSLHRWKVQYWPRCLWNWLDEHNPIKALLFLRLPLTLMQNRTSVPIALLGRDQCEPRHNPLCVPRLVLGAACAIIRRLKRSANVGKRERPEQGHV